MVWNLSEESYDNSRFADQVLEYKFPGHPAPPLGLLFKICTSVESWLDADEKNVTVIHCVTGKGRTATVLACVLAWIGEFSTPLEALRYISDRRSIPVDSLTIPSQRRYLQYFSNMLDRVKPRAEPLLLRRVIINNIPNFNSDVMDIQNSGCCPYIQLFKNGALIANANPTTQSTANSESGPMQKSTLPWINCFEGSASFTVDCLVRGDILLRCRHCSPNGERVSMFRAAFHTGYVPCGVLRLNKAQLDGANSDIRFTDDFFIDLIFAPVENDNTGASETVQDPSGTTAAEKEYLGEVGFATKNGSVRPTDSGLVLDHDSRDRYDQMLHRDKRFWEAVATRKAKGKRRRSRQFVTRHHESFSIGDELGPSSPTDQEDSNEHLSVGGSSSAVSTSGISDRDLIMQLAEAEDEDATMNSAVAILKPPTGGLSGSQTPLGRDEFVVDTPSYPLSTGGLSASSGHSAGGRPEKTAADAELFALDELERELGIGYVGSNGSGSSGVEGLDLNSILEADRSVGTPAAADSFMGTSDESLDELEQYLQSLSSGK